MAADHFFSFDVCIRQTESVYGRWGARSLLKAKFVPGFASIASALAGVVGTPLRTFVLFDTLGAPIWVGSAVFLGSLFSSTVQDLLDVLTALGKWGLLLLCVAFPVFVARKWWQRQRAWCVRLRCRACRSRNWRGSTLRASRRR